MVRGMAKEDANTGTVGPLIVCVVRLKVVFEDVNWGTKGMEVIEVGFNLGS